ncbi:MAG: archaeosortase/exosortase family protein [Halioglobus sp.]
MPDSRAAATGVARTTRRGLWLAAFYGIALLLVFHATTWSMISIWLRSETFAHGFLILPISLWLAWSQRERLWTTEASSAPWVLALLLPLGAGWLLAHLVSVLVVQQLALVAMLVVGIWAILGHRQARVLAFPPDVPVPGRAHGGGAGTTG